MVSVTRIVVFECEGENMPDRLGDSFSFFSEQQQPGLLA